MNLPELYAKVVSVKPEARVVGLLVARIVEDGEDAGVSWVDAAGHLVPDDYAEGSVLAHWVGMLPQFYMLMRTGPTLWRVGNEDHICWQQHDTPLKALAAWLMEKQA